MPALPAGILPCLLTRDRRQRIALEHTALGALLLVGGAGLMHAMATAGLNDPRVAYWEPAKWVARLRTVNQGTRPILLKTEMGAGHGGPSGRYDAWRDEAFILAFVLDQLGVGKV